MATVVQEWGAPGLSPNGANGSSPNNVQVIDLDERIQRQAEENGIERPRGYTVSFHYNPEVESHHFGRSHPMKPWRLHLTKQLVLSYGLQYAMDLYHTRPASKDEFAEFHTEDYLDFLEHVTPDNMLDHQNELISFNFGDDCPVFDGLYDYCSLYTGSSLNAARILSSTCPPNSNACDIAINWSGGLHHAKKSQASGFCYINDIVLCILHLLQTHPRVLYIDLDVHHGDGVEAAFHSSDRVLTLSLHKYDPEEFFPGTGGVHETGPESPHNPGAHHSLNIPLKDGIDDDQYIRLFKAVCSRSIETFRPTAIVLQCGADSLGGDRLGKFNLNIRAHGECLTYVKNQGLPLLVLGGGGYTARNVARLWCHETSLCTGSELANELPDYLPYRKAFEGTENGDGQLYPNLSHIETRRHRNDHNEEYLRGLIKKMYEQLSYIKGAPSVQMQRIPKDIWSLRAEIDRSIREGNEDGYEGEQRRRQLERNTGGRMELG